MHERQRYEHLGDVVIGVILKNQEKTLFFQFIDRGVLKQNFMENRYTIKRANGGVAPGNRNRDLPLVRSYQDDLF